LEAITGMCGSNSTQHNPSPSMVFLFFFIVFPLLPPLNTLALSVLVVKIFDALMYMNNWKLSHLILCT